MREGPVEYYLHMDIRDDNYQLAQRFIWCGKDRGWRRVKDVYECLFRVVPLFTSAGAYRLKEEMEGTGFFYPQVFRDETLVLGVMSFWDANLYVFSAWDDEEGVTHPIAIIRASNWDKASNYFKETYPDEFKTGEGQVAHISRCRYTIGEETLKSMNLVAYLIGSP